MNEKNLLGTADRIYLNDFCVSALITGQVPMWVRIGYPTAAMWLMMIYDEALFELREQKEPTPFSASVSSKNEK
ncbi:hypothetical protein ACK4CS_15140 [Enterococcus gallinarum]|uniref:Uncharacterized protein n=1 Tax=Enterococcus gallinarum TaxID=1353 RepID=A0A376GWP8_ENTGA|nr:hypothetical protein [Enterococcus gallinarum]MDT2692003.1 hypothetical protein [Enterococcus gallinarum]STD73258.1 Uncharacterised protein [Enterococcus gallinarum]STD82112.1 Uncharacterised protein [Enterococcus gallinarum]